jgi:hypothetical protein
MRRPQSWIPLMAMTCWVASCGFGFADDTGKPIPSPDYWGWMCADGSQPDPDAGCPPPGPCADLSLPTLMDDGTCVCGDGAMLPAADCETPGPCADGSDPSIGDDGNCDCDDGSTVDPSDCETPDGGSGY